MSEPLLTARQMARVEADLLRGLKEKVTSTRLAKLQLFRYRIAYVTAITSPHRVCPYCVETILPWEPFTDGATQRFHRECLLRAVAGSSAHQLGECSCYGGSREDPPNMTRRQAAVLAFETFQLMERYSS